MALSSTAAVAVHGGVMTVGSYLHAHANICLPPVRVRARPAQRERLCCGWVR